MTSSADGDILSFLEKAMTSSTVSSYAVAAYEWVLKEPSPLTQGFPMMDIRTMFLFVFAYLSFVLFGRMIMAERKPFNLYYFAILHNFFLMVLSLYMCGEALRQAYKLNYGLFCNAYDDTPRSQGMANIVWIFYVSKAYEFIDTVIMILRKKFEQVSFLHVYHHVTIFSIWWFLAYRVPTGEVYYSVALNSFVHVVMYSYYLGTCFKIQFPWKKYITSFQMFQFVTMMCQASWDLYNDCYSREPCWVLFYYMITLLALFANFFRKSYGSKRSRGEKKTA